MGESECLWTAMQTLEKQWAGSLRKEKKQESVWSRPVITGSSRTGKISVTIERNIR